MCLRILTWVDRVVEATSTNVDTHLTTCVYIFLREVAGLRLHSATFGYTLRHRSPEVDQNDQFHTQSASTWGRNTVKPKEEVNSTAPGPERGHLIRRSSGTLELRYFHSERSKKNPAEQ
ncbi:hypothetical protein C8R44DRAFT_733347 [Mycena epipterygia]|nr:hypothetical protein C8R44DRAFT_733347 [Mycena epipterygia]